MFSRSMSSISDADPSRYASTCTRSGPARARPAGEVRVDAHQHEGRGNDALPDAQALTEALREGGLAGAQFARQDQQVPRPEHLRQSRAEGVGLVRRRNRQGLDPERSVAGLRNVHGAGVSVAVDAPACSSLTGASLT